MNELMPIEDARAQVLAAIPAPLPAEEVDLSDALGRVLAADVVAATDLPPWDNSAMDGYAIRSADVAAATEDDPVLLRVAGEVAAGRASEIAVAPGLALRIATGAPTPPGADAVVAVGPGKKNEDGRVVPVNVKVGDKVMFSKYGFDEIKVNGVEYYIVTESSILAILD